MTATQELRLPVPDLEVEVSGLLLRPEEARALLVLAHGAGAGMEHPFLLDLAQALASAGIATLRYQFPYMEKGQRRPDRAPRLIATVRAAVAEAARRAPDLPLLAGGKSMGGRMTSHAVAQDPLPGVRGLVFFGFPLHPAGKPGTKRGDHLAQVPHPMLFLQGSRDKLADLHLLTHVLRPLEGQAKLHIVEGADHGFHVLKRSGRTDDEVRAELVDQVVGWLAAL